MSRPPFKGATIGTAFLFLIQPPARMIPMRTFFRTNSKAFTLVEVMTVVGIMSIVVAIATPTWMRARLESQQKSCQENLTKIDGAKEQWAMETIQPPDATPDLRDLYHKDGFGYLKTEPRCPASGEYELGSVAEPTRCSIVEPRDHNDFGRRD
jgi:prepilin-type N-terminal cleavage/methylation domain-containing protein